jgi:hypothetical protein
MKSDAPVPVHDIPGNSSRSSTLCLVETNVTVSASGGEMDYANLGKIGLRVSRVCLGSLESIDEKDGGT